jgi:branched-chain amino acid transport system ATP-binding protein
MSAISVLNLCKRFGGVAAIDDLSFSVERGTVYAIIGPNGAGKTTLINLLSGIYSPDAGSILVLGKDSRNEAPERLATWGLSRTFQNIQVCLDMGALENVMIGAHTRLNAGFAAALIRLPQIVRRDRELRLEADELMAFVGLDRYRHADAAAMPYGALKRLEIARALAAKPQVLLLDEPAAGLNHTETDALRALIEKVAATGVTILLVEHDMKLVMTVSERILVLDYGRKLAEGSPGEVRSDRSVIAAYLGAEA